MPSGLDAQVREFAANDPGSLQAILEQHPGEVAAVILAPEMMLPHDPRVFHELVRLTHAHGAVFVMDEVKTGVRIGPGSVSELVGVVPDVITLSKALGNGWSVAAVLGRREVMSAGDGMHYSATFHGDTAGMAAALTTLSLVESTGAREHVWRLGSRLIAGLNQLAGTHGIPGLAWGEPLPPMPFFAMRHPDEPTKARLTRAFFEGMLIRGVLLHPRHMWFISLAHTEEDIARTLDAADEVMREIGKEA